MRFGQPITETSAPHEPQPSKDDTRPRRCGPQTLWERLAQHRTSIPLHQQRQHHPPSQLKEEMQRQARQWTEKQNERGVKKRGKPPLAAPLSLRLRLRGFWAWHRRSRNPRSPSGFTFFRARLDICVGPRVFGLGVPAQWFARLTHSHATKNNKRTIDILKRWGV